MGLDNDHDTISQIRLILGFDMYCKMIFLARIKIMSQHPDMFPTVTIKEVEENI